MKLRRINLLILKTMCLVTFVSTSCTTDQANHVKTLEIAMNGHQVNEILAFFKEDLTFKMGGYNGQGILEFKKIAEWDSVLNATYSFYDVEVHGDSVIFKARLSNDLMKAMGFESGIADPAILTYTDGMISHLSFNMTPEDKKRDQQIWSSFMMWAKDKKQDQLRDLMPEGKFIIDGVTAKGWLELFREWKRDVN